MGSRDSGGCQQPRLLFQETRRNTPTFPGLQLSRRDPPPQASNIFTLPIQIFISVGTHSRLVGLLCIALGKCHT